MDHTEISSKNYNHSMLMKNSSYKKYTTTKKDDDRPQDFGLKVHVHYNDIGAVDGALRRLRKRMDTELVMEEFYEHTYFTKKSTKIRESRKRSKHLAGYKK